MNKNLIKSQLFIVALLGKIYSFAEDWSKQGQIPGFNEEDFVVNIKSIAQLIVEECDEWLNEKRNECQ